MKRALAFSFLAVALAASAFGAIERIATVADADVRPVVVDLDRDGLDDLVVNNTALLSRGGGTFVKQSLEVALGAGAIATDTLDFNGDGYLDLLTKNWDGRDPKSLPTFRIHPGTATPFQFGKAIVIDSEGDGTPYLADLDGDGKNDFLLVHPVYDETARKTYSIVIPELSRGDGTFVNRTAMKMDALQFGPFRSSYRLPQADLDHDGRPDLLLRTEHDLMILRAKGNGDFDLHSRFLPVQRFSAWEMQLGDIDGDGNVDAVLVWPRVVHVLFGDGRGDFNRHAMLFLPQFRQPFVPAGVAPTNTDHRANTPRNLILGEFVKKGRTEIAGTLVEGDLFVLAYENGQLREVAPRVPTEFVQGEVFAGSFRSMTSSDIVVTYNLATGSAFPKPALFAADAAPGGDARPVRTTRGRTVGRSRTELKLTVFTSGCGVDVTSVPVVMDAGIWGHSADATAPGDVMIDAEGLLHLRFFPWWEPYGIWTTLQPQGANRWEGSVLTTAFIPEICRAGMARVVVETVH